MTISKEYMADHLYQKLLHLYNLQEIKNNNQSKNILKTNYRQLIKEMKKSRSTVNRYLINLELRGKIKKDFDHILSDKRILLNQLFIEILKI